MSYCEGKRKYTTAEQADEARRALIAKGGDHKRRAKLLRVYRCEKCSYWHVGHAYAKVKDFTRKPKGPTPGEQRRAEKRKARREYLGTFLRIIDRLTERDMRLNGRA